MRKSWPIITLRELIRRKKVEIAVQELETYSRLTIHMNGGGISIRDRSQGSAIGTKFQFVVKAGQLVLSKIDARNGAFGIVPLEGNGAIITGNFWAYDVNSELLNIDFFNYLTKTPLFIDFCVRASDGTTNRLYLQEAKFLAQKILLPPIEEQYRIVARIEELATKIEKAQVLHKRAIEERELLKEAAAYALFFGHDKISQPLRDLVTISGGGTPSKSNPFFWEGTIPWISPKDMKVRDISDAIDHISEQAIVESSAKLIDPGAVLIVVRGMILTHTVPSAVLRVPATINQDMKALIPNAKILPEYLRSGLWALNKELLNLVEKSTHDTRKLETSKLLAWKIPVPPISEQQRIVTYLEELQSKVDALKRGQAKTSTKLDAMLPSILDKAFKGEL